MVSVPVVGRLVTGMEAAIVISVVVSTGTTPSVLLSSGILVETKLMTGSRNSNGLDWRSRREREVGMPAESGAMD